MKRWRNYCRLKRIARLEDALEISPPWALVRVCGYGEEFFDMPESERLFRKALR